MTRAPVRSSTVPVSSVELICLAALSAVYVAALNLLPGENKISDAINALGPALFLVIMGVGAYLTAKRNPAAIITAPFWFRISCAVYYGFGNLVPFIANPYTLDYIYTFYHVSTPELTKINAISTIGAFLVLATLAVLNRAVPRPRLHSAARRSSRELEVVSVVFGAVGILSECLLVIPNSIGAFGNFTVPSFIMTLGLTLPVAIFLGTLNALSKSLGHLIYPALLLCFQVACSLLLAEKSGAVFGTLMFSLALAIHRLDKRGILFGIALCTGVYTTILPIVDFSRSEIISRFGCCAVADVPTRLAILGEYIGGRRMYVNETQAGDIQGSLVRLSNINQAGFGVSQFDTGHPGNSLSLAFSAVVPRIIWRDKPSITGIAANFNELATGNRQSQSGPGLFAEAYWNLGWWGLFLIMPIIGGVLYCLGRYGLWMLNSGDWWSFPIGLLALRIGARADGFFAADIVGASITVLALHFLFQACRALLNVDSGVDRMARAAHLKAANEGRSAERLIR